MIFFDHGSRQQSDSLVPDDRIPSLQGEGRGGKLRRSEFPCHSGVQYLRASLKSRDLERQRAWNGQFDLRSRRGAAGDFE